MDDSYDSLPPYPGVPFPGYPTQYGVAPPPPPPTTPRPSRRWLGGTLGAGALLLAAGAFLLGRGTAHATPSTVPTATALGALSSATAAPSGPGGALCAGPHGIAAGTLKSVSGSTLTVTRLRGGDVTVKTDSNTKVTRVVKGALSDVVAGSAVAVHGKASGTSAIAADQVAVLPVGSMKLSPKAPAGMGPRAAAAGFAVGTVQSVTSTGFTVTSGGTTITITTSSSTEFSKTVTGTVGDLVVGQPIAATGTPNSDGSITATNIEQAGPGSGLGSFAGVGPGPGPGFGHGPRGHG